jgi:DNA-directed RNA polymerase subunit H (RpoH/RPB5)
LIGDCLKELDITKHESVPKHILLNEKEKEEMLKNFGISLKQIPRIPSSDPIVMAFNGKPGDVVKIIRRSQTAGETIYYRVIVKG